MTVQKTQHIYRETKEAAQTGCGRDEQCGSDVERWARGASHAGKRWQMSICRHEEQENLKRMREESRQKWLRQGDGSLA